MEKKIKLAIILLILSVSLNVTTFMRVKEAENKIENLRNEINVIYNNMENSISSANRNIDRKLEEFVNNNSWIINEEFIFDEEKSKSDEIHVDLQWSFSEIQEGSNVFLTYKSEIDNDVKVEAIKKDNGVYSAHLVLSPKEYYKYKIIVEGQNFRVGEEKNVPERLYMPEPLELISWGYGRGNNEIQNFTIEILQKSIKSSIFSPARVQLIINYKDGDKEVKDFENIDSNEEITMLKGHIESFEKQPETIYLEVKYKDGNIESEEVWPVNRFFDEKYN